LNRNNRNNLFKALLCLSNITIVKAA